MINTYIYNMRKELNGYAIKVQNEYYANKSVSKYRIKYLIVVKIYENIMSLNDEKSIKEYLKILLDNSNKCRTIYDDLYKKYSNEKNIEEKSKLLKQLNEHAFRINAYNECYNIISKHFTKKDELNNEDTITSDKIISLLEKYNEMDKNTSEANSLLKEIYDIRVNRENEFKELHGDNYRVYISELESLENMASMMNTEEFKTRELNSNDYILELRDTINAINEYYFINELKIKKYYKNNNNISDGNNNNKFYKKYNNYLRKYRVLISSLFGSSNIEFEVDGQKITTDDLLSYLATCNLDGDLSVYKNKFLGVQIGTENTDKNKYIESLVFLNKCINTLCNIAEKKSKNKVIKIIDKEPIKKDIITKRNNKLREIYLQSQITVTTNKGISL